MWALADVFTLHVHDAICEQEGTFDSLIELEKLSDDWRDMFTSKDQ